MLFYRLELLFIITICLGYCFIYIANASSRFHCSNDLEKKNNNNNMVMLLVMVSKQENKKTLSSW